MKTIQLTKNKQTIIDDIDFELVSKYKWCFDGRYAISRIKGIKVYLHRMLLDAVKNECCDHLNLDKLDNTRVNLRKCSQSENNRNRLYPTKNGYKGITENKRNGKWKAQITYNYKHINIGTFLTKKEAASAYDKYAKGLHGKFSKTNA